MKEKNDFNQEEYVSKVDSAHEKLKGLEERLKHVEEITDGGLILRTFQTDSKLQESFEKFIWQTIVHRAWLVFFSLLGAAIAIPLLSKIFSIAMFRMFGVNM